MRAPIPVLQANIVLNVKTTQQVRASWAVSCRSIAPHHRSAIRGAPSCCLAGRFCARTSARGVAAFHSCARSRHRLRFVLNASAAGHVQSRCVCQCVRRFAPHRQRRRRAAGMSRLPIEWWLCVLLFQVSVWKRCCFTFTGAPSCLFPNRRHPLRAANVPLLTLATVRINGLNCRRWPIVIARHALAIASEQLVASLLILECRKSQMF